MRKKLKHAWAAEQQKRQANPGKYEADKKAAKLKSDTSEFKQPPLMGLLTRLFRGVKYNIKNIHVRYEDDYFVRHIPFSFGFTLGGISLDNHISEEER